MGNDDVLLRELYFLVYKFLETSPCNDTLNVFRNELEQKGLLPEQYQWTSGITRPSTLCEVQKANPHITADYLFRVLCQSRNAISQISPPPIDGISTFLSSGRFSLLRSLTKKDTLLGQNDSSHDEPISSLVNYINKAPTLPSARFNDKFPRNVLSSLISREISGPKSITHLWPANFYGKYKQYCRRIGHLSAVFCVLFDRTGRYIFTGADDHLVKIWSADDGKLLSTLRGHMGEITDLAINYENTMLATGSCDKMIRVWCLKTTAPIVILNDHTAHITSVRFCPLMSSDDRYLVSTANDGCVCFWQYNAQTKVFNEKPIKFVERTRPNTHILCSTFSTGGVFLAIGCTDNYIRIYHVTAPLGPAKILEIQQHPDHVDSIQFSNFSAKLTSSSRDGVAFIWHYEKQNWRSIEIDPNLRLPGTPPPRDEPSRKLRISTIGWSSDDKYVITSINDCSIKVWESRDAKLKHVLYGHQDEVFVLESHPNDARIFLSAGHDGAVFLWDVVTGTSLNSFYNGADSCAIFDCKFSPDGFMFASTDNHGYLTLFGITQANPYEKIPEQLFFHTDYRPLIRDSNNYALDEQTQIAPHLMSPPFLVDIDGNPYPPNVQRLVPGREFCSAAQLIPTLMEEGPVANPEPRQRQTIDHMIQQLQRNAEQPNQVANNVPVGNDLNLQDARNRDRNALNQRNNGDVEGVRHSANFVTSGQLIRPFWHKKPVVTCLSDAEIVVVTQKQNDMARLEEEYYQAERRKKQDVHEVISIKIASQQQRFTRSKKRIIQQRRGVRSSVFSAQDGDNPVETDDENDEDFTGSSNTSEESDESDDSDWNTPSMPTAEASTSRKRKRNEVSSDDDARPETSKRRSMNTDHDDGDLRQSQLNQIRYLRCSKKYQTLTELPEEFKMPEWLTDCKPKRTPYFPQIGDEVVYFRFGHQKYIDLIKSFRLYNLSSSVKPYKLRGIDRDEIFAKIVDIRYDVKPPRLVTLKMMVIDPEAEEPFTGINFTVRYHDVANVVDFIILKKLYDTSIARNWNINDEFRSVIDDKWWFGKIDSIRHSNDSSYFQCFDVTWSNGDKEWLSPWDLEPIVDAVSDEYRHEGIPVTDEERFSFNIINDEEWPIATREEDRQRLVNGFIRIMQFSHAEEFSVPVDLNVHPIYGIIIAYPMDLSTVKSRIENNFYRRISTIKFDVNFIETNALNYNESNSDIVKKAKVITRVCNRFIDDDQCFDPLPIYLEVLSEANAQPSPSTSEPTNSVMEMQRTRRSLRRPRILASDSDNDHSFSRVRSQSSRMNNVSSRRFSKQSNRDTDSWKVACRKLLDQLLRSKDSEPFRSPVDPIQYPNYSHVIDTPMDLTTVKEQLLAGVYETSLDFRKDMRLIFMNSKTFNTNKKSRIYSMTIRLSNVFEEKMREILSNYKSSSRSKRSSSSKRPRHLPLSQIHDNESRICRNSSRVRTNRQSTLAIHDLSQPSSSYTHRSSQRINRQVTLNIPRASSSNSSSEKYGLRRRNKQLRRRYKEDSDESMDEADQDNYSASYRSSRIFDSRARRRAHYDHEEIEEEPAINDDIDNDLTDEEEKVKSPLDNIDEEEEEEEEDDDETENDETENEETDIDGDDNVIERDDEENHVDSDATQVDETDDDDMEENDKENTKGRRRPSRAAARKLVNYDENNDDESDTEVIREKSVNVRTRITRSSFAQINETSRESMSSNRSSNRASLDSEDEASRPVRRSQRKVRPRRRYSSESDFEANTRKHSSRQLPTALRTDYHVY